MTEHLARSNDPETSHLAAESLDLTMNERNHNALWTLQHVIRHPRTDLEMAELLSRYGHGKEETCRRMIRTLREHEHLVPAYDADGKRIRHVNSTGMTANCWITP